MNNEQDIINKVFAGCTILEKIGQGAMGSVYKAHYHLLNKTVCVKILAKELAYDQRNIEFFMREAKSASKLDHPNVVHVYKYGEEEGKYYIVMSYVDGKTLQDILNEKKILSIPEATDYIIGILEGIEHAHSKNIIHRDIKPSNILITKDGVPRIADFGLARSVNEEKQLTIAGEMVGTAYFMSPEQGLAKQVDTRADLYALGATYFYLITGKYPFEGKTSVEVISKHINEPMPNLFLIKPDIPVWTAKVIEKLMKKDPDERYQTAKEVLIELKKYKEKNYQDDLQQVEKNYDIQELKKTEEKTYLKTPIKKTESRNTIVDGLTIDRYSSFEMNKSKEFLKTKTEKPLKKEILKTKKQELSFIEKTIKIIYHFSFLIVILFLTIFLGITIQNQENYLISILYPFIKWTIPSLVVTSLIILFITGIIYIKPLRATPIYIFSLVLMIITSYIGSNLTIYPMPSDSLSKLFFNFKNSLFSFLNPQNFWATSFAFLLISFKLSSKENIYFKITSSILFVVSFLIFYAYLKNISDPNIKLIIDKYDYAIYVLIFLAIISNLIKGMMFIFFNPSILIIISFFILFTSFKESNIKAITEEITKQDEIRVKKQRELAILELKIKTLSDTIEYDQEGKPMINKEKIKKTYKDIKPKSKEEIENIAKKDLYEKLKKYFMDSILYHSGLIILSITIFLILNYMFFEELIFYEKEFSTGEIR